VYAPLRAQLAWWMILNLAPSHWPRIAPTVSLISSHKSSKCLSQMGDLITGAYNKAFLRVLKATRQLLSKLNQTFFCKRLVRGFEILEKFFINLP
jgi:hypothetical protein